MTLSEVKNILPSLEHVSFKLENGTKVPEHFHVTEIGVVDKHFIDCGGTIRVENVINFQLWNANDYDHRLKPEKLLNIIRLSEDMLGLKDREVEIEYQIDTIGKYSLGYDGNSFILISKKANCLASDNCGMSQSAKQKIRLSDLPVSQSVCCTSEGGCC